MLEDGDSILRALKRAGRLTLMTSRDHPLASKCPRPPWIPANLVLFLLDAGLDFLHRQQHVTVPLILVLARALARIRNCQLFLRSLGRSASDLLDWAGTLLLLRGSTVGVVRGGGG